MNRLLNIICLCCLTAVIYSCDNDRKVIEYKGIPADKTSGLYNPGRGFRLETAVDVVTDTIDPAAELKNLSFRYASDSVSLTQCYFYLTELYDKNLEKKHLEVMQKYFDEMRLLGKKAVLRFAYERDFIRRKPIGPKLPQILSHLEQLKPFLEKNKDLILVVQAGLIGAWGEWHSSIHGLENSDSIKTAVLEKLLSVVPEELDVQVRLPDFKNLLKSNEKMYSRLSFHDDFIVIKPDRWDGGMHEGTDNYNQIVKESPYLAVDGEMPWGFWSVGKDPDSPSAGWIIEGLPAARRLFMQHYTSLSVIHNYKEQHANNIFDENNPPEYSMVVWKKTMLTADSLIKYNLPVSDNYFTTSKGENVPRSAFDYIRDHLGYRIELQRFATNTLWNKNKSNHYNLTLINRGFSTVHGTYDVYLALIDENSNVYLNKVNCNPEDWQPYMPGDSNYRLLLHRIDGDFILPENINSGKYKLGLIITDSSDRLQFNPKYSIRCANDIQWLVVPENRYGINILTDAIYVR